MNLNQFIIQYTLKDIVKIEQEKDFQFIALKNVWQEIKKLPFAKEKLIGEYLYMIVQNALVSYQLSGKGENRREEFAGSLVKYFENLDDIDNIAWRKSMLSSCKNNCRLDEIKLKRIQKISKHKNVFTDYKMLYGFYKDMVGLNVFLAEIMNQKKDDKTIVFAVKMFGYGARIAFEEYIEYPFGVNIPIDSRLEKIYELQTGKEKIMKSEIKNYFKNLSEIYKIPPLHLDSLLWIEYWEKIALEK